MPCHCRSVNVRVFSARAGGAAVFILTLCFALRIAGKDTAAKGFFLFFPGQFRSIPGTAKKYGNAQQKNRDAACHE
jgi:hypothetical protein